MKRQERQQVQKWLKELHPYANEEFRLRRKGTFPSDQATIRRYFAWCKRHKLPPTDRASFGLYWGVGEPHTIGKIKCAPIFASKSPAYLEKRFGPSRVHYGPNTPRHEGETKDSWWVVVEFITKDQEWLETNHFCRLFAAKGERRNCLTRFYEN